MGLAAGRAFGRFQIVRRLGAGAMGEVYLGEDPRIGRQLAIKTVRVETDGEDTDERRTRLLREARAVGQIVHPHVVTLFDAGEIDGTFYLAFEYVEGSDLAVRLRELPPLSLAETLRMARETAAGLAAAHRRAVVHRDIKPANLLLTADGSVKISDFGIAKLIDSTTDMTQAGLLVGTPHFLSPEQVRSEPLDGRSDLYSLGVVLYDVLAGRRPFSADTLSALLYQILSADPVPLEQAAPHVPTRVSALVMRLLAKNVDDRFQSAEALVETIARIERDLDLGPVDARTARTSASPAPPALRQACDQTARADSEAAGATHGVARNTIGAEGVGRSRRNALWAVVALVVLLISVVAVGLYRWRTDSPARHDVSPPSTASTDADEPRPAVSEGRTVGPAALNAPAGDATSSVDTARVDPPVDGRDVQAARVVGGAITLAVSPVAAARVAVVKIDGLVRGPAAGSLVSLRPGVRRVEVTAEGYEPLIVLVDVRPDEAAPTTLTLAMQPR